MRPFKVRGDHAAGVCKNVRDDSLFRIHQYLVCARGDRSIRSLDDYSRPHIRSVPSRDHVFDSRRYQNIAVQFEQLVVFKLVRVGYVRDASPLGYDSVQFVEVETRSIDNGTIDVRYCNHSRPVIGHGPCRRRTNRPVTLDGDCALLGRRPTVDDRPAGDDRGSSSGRFRSTQRPSQFDRFSGHDTGGMSVNRTVRIHDPGHSLRGSTQVGGGNIPVHSKNMVHAHRVAPGQPVKLVR